VEIQADADRLPLAREFVRDDQIPPVAVPAREVLVVAREERLGLARGEVDDAVGREPPEPLDGVRPRLPVLAVGSQYRDAEALYPGGRVQFTPERPDLPRPALPEAVRLPRRPRNPVPLCPVVDDAGPRRATGDFALVVCRRQAAELVAVVVAQAHAPTVSFAQKNPPVSFRCG
jgi:hypothetical protein